MSSKEVKRINLWSLPRCASTATMYSFAQRQDTKVFDEPLYCAYLVEYPHLYRPYREELLQVGEHDINAVVENIIMGPAENGELVRFYKNITSQFLPNMRRDFLANTDHFFLIRHPYRIVASYFRANGSVTMDDTGLPRMLEALEEVEKTGYKPLVIDNSDLLRIPEIVLRKVCESCGIEFETAMLQWQAGGIPEDGLWASYWYTGTHKSTGFVPEAEKPLQEQDQVLDGLPEEVKQLAAECLPIYEKLRDRRFIFENELNESQIE